MSSFDLHIEFRCKESMERGGESKGGGRREEREGGGKEGEGGGERGREGENLQIHASTNHVFKFIQRSCQNTIFN